MSGVTRRLDECVNDNTPLAEPEAKPQPPKSLPMHFELRVASTGETIRVSVQDTVIIGRKDPAHRVQPDVDLTPHRGYPCGVSRSHAMIIVRDKELWIRALSATNSTHVNDAALITGQEHLLNDGDELKLGALRLRVTFVAVAASSAP